MTPAREHTDDYTDFDAGELEWPHRSAFGSRGVPWWGAVLLAVLLTAIGTAVDLLLNAKPGALFTSCYIVGCLLGIVLVQRRSLFGPMVQPPLVLAIVMPVIVLLAGHNASAGTSARLLSVAAPLITSFPAMASTTGVTVIIGLLRIYFQRKPEMEGDPDEETVKRPAAATVNARQSPPDRAKGRRQPPEAAGSGRPRRPGAEPRSAADKQERARDRAPGRARAGEGTPERGNRATPGRSSGGRQTPPGRQQRATPPRNPRRPPREDFWN